MGKAFENSKAGSTEAVAHAQSAQPRIVNCPHCGAAVAWGPQSPFRPFCSERCRKLDLGAWASDSYRIAGGAPPDDFSQPDPESTPRE